MLRNCRIVLLLLLIQQLTYIHSIDGELFPDDDLTGSKESNARDIHGVSDLQHVSAIPDNGNTLTRQYPGDILLKEGRHAGEIDKRAVQRKDSGNTNDTASPSTADAVDSTTKAHPSGEEVHEEGNHVEPTRMQVASWNFEHVRGPLIIAVFLITAGVAKLGFHHANFLSSKVPESCLLIILGTIVGAVLYGVIPAGSSHETLRPTLDSDLFFLYLLPPIILESAYSLHDRTFYDNVGTVMVYAVLGTVLNCFMIGPSLYGVYQTGAMGSGMPPISLVQCLVFSAIIVAVDPVAVLAIFQEIGVNNTLYFLVFGESLFNDAVTVVLYNMMKTLNRMEHITVDQICIGVVQFFVVSLGGLGIGIILGMLTAVLTKYTEHCRVVEPLAVFVLAYISYLAAEMFHLSGIISIIGCGLVQAQYAFHNISRKSYTTVKYFSKMMSATSDCVIFLFLGISLFKADVLNLEHWHLGFILWTLLFCLLYRFIVVFLLTVIINRLHRVRKIDLEEQFIMAYGGLRGAVAFSLVGVLNPKNLPKGHFLTTTLTVIFFTVFIQGSTIKPLVKLLRVKMEKKEQQLLSEEINSHVTDHVMAGIEEISGQRGSNSFREKLEQYNRRYLKIFLQRDPVSTDDQIMAYFNKLALQQHFEHLGGSKMIMEKYGSEQVSLEEFPIDDDEAFPGTPSEGGSVCGDITFPVPSLNASSEDINSELDREMMESQATRRRKSLFPVALTRDMETRLQDNPTAMDVRKIMVPSRRHQQYKRLDKNLKNDNSENDLLTYLQNKQMRTRRMSQALWNTPISESPEIPENRPRRKSLAPNVATNNYRRRLSLAVPTPDHEGGRRRGVSVGNVLKGLDSPARRRLRFRRNAPSTASSEDRVETSNLCPVSENENEEDNNGVKFCLENEMESRDKKLSHASNADRDQSNVDHVTHF
ncbi:Na(+)/H(+) exchanger beta-like isoform X2 [Mya arenaria]|uniref:Na(+)/H(+) exchanger beta-like isoform X2 n=1 Tax=Mya arenaria TaxID=6604 RepID=UPI0022E625D6|nr:Na(+)/H(+) exchanger beta-like isoform X2 [Mya arenaria]